MSILTCAHEQEVAQLLRRGHWPTCADPELSAHVAACRRCSDLVLVTQAFRNARKQSLNEAGLNEARFDGSSLAAPVLASPGLLWWRAQLRLRNAAVERIAKPISRAQIFALMINLLVASGLAASQRKHVASWLVSIRPGSPQPESVSASSATVPTHTAWQSMLQLLNSMSHGWNLALLISSVSALLILGLVAIYMTTDRA